MHKHNKGFGGKFLCSRVTRLFVAVFIFALGIIITNASPVFAGSVDDFYFEDYTADYYLDKDDEGVSTLKVKERFTAIFPDYRQNKGICRGIPFTNQNGRNRTLDSLSKKDITVTRNGITEPIYSIETEDGEYVVCTGTEDYIMGKQAFTFVYTFHRVVTEYEDAGKIWQELYWDTNGTGSKQRTDKLTARLHVKDMSVLTGDAWCYVGKEGYSNQSRCEVTKTSDGFTFKAENLSPYENLSFDVEIKPNSFIIPDPEETYMVVWATVSLVTIFCIVIAFSARKFNKVKTKRELYKETLVKPEYEPLDKYDMHVLSEAYIGKRGNASVATLIKLIVEGKVKLIKGDKKLLGGYKWSLEAVDVSNINRSEELVLKVLNKGDTVHNGEIITLKQTIATTKLTSARESLARHGSIYGHTKGLIEKTTVGSIGSALGSGLATVGMFMVLQASMFFFIPVVIFITDSTLDKAENIDLNDVYWGGRHVASLPLSIGIMITAIILFIFINSYLKRNTKKYVYRTEEGIRVSRYLDGLKMYIKMAEQERIAFLQSVPGADVSPEGIVKLYEKLLPYAVFFGLEKTWMKEMQQYCEACNINISAAHLNVSDLAVMNSFVQTAPSTSSLFSPSYSSSSGSGSSGHSGGGGGGFSGGGGGGGSVGGR